MRFDIGTLDVGERSLPFGLLVSWFIHVYSLSRGRQPIWAKILMSIEQPHHFNLSLYTFFHELINAYSHGAGADNPQETKIDVNRKILSLRSFFTNLKKKYLWSLILYTFLMISYMHVAPGQGQTVPWGQNFNVNRKALSLCPFVASLKKLWCVILYIFFHAFIRVYSPRADNPLGTKF